MSPDHHILSVDRTTSYHLFLQGPRAKNSFNLLNVWKKMKEESYIVTYRNDMKFKFQHPTSFHVVYACFHSTVAEESSYDGDHVA